VISGLERTTSGGLRNGKRGNGYRVHKNKIAFSTVPFLIAWVSFTKLERIEAAAIKTILFLTPSPTCSQGAKAMTKGVEGKKEAKKQPAKTKKEKRAEKRLKKAARGALRG